MKIFEKGSKGRQLLSAVLITDIALAVTGGTLLLLSRLLRPLGLYFCPLARFGHLYCPACGGTRSVEMLLRFDLLGSLRYHPVGLLLLLALLYYNGLAALSLATGKEGYLRRARLWPIWVIAGVMLLHFAVRNVLLIFFGIDPIGDLLPYYTS